MRVQTFVDTSYIVALANSRDAWHDAAIQWSGKIDAEQIQLVTTEFVLAEIGDSLASMMRRASAAAIIRALQSNRFVEIVPASSSLFEAACRLYESRVDKDWGLTDCTSFVAMKERGLEDALTVDRHFQQAGFRALLLED